MMAARANSWYYTFRGQTYGPFALAQIRNLALTGQIPREAVVYCFNGQTRVRVNWRQLFLKNPPAGSATSATQVPQTVRALAVPPPLPETASVVPQTSPWPAGSPVGRPGNVVMGSRGPASQRERKLGWPILAITLSGVVLVSLMVFTVVSTALVWRSSSNLSDQLGQKGVRTRQPARAARSAASPPLSPASVSCHPSVFLLCSNRTILPPSQETVSNSSNVSFRLKHCTAFQDMV